MNPSREKRAGAGRVRCAVYVRKSTEEGLEKEFNSLDAQREAGEAYIASQRSEGWICLPDRYDDGGFTGGNMERPGLKRLLADVAAGEIDCVVVYKVDRLSRSLLDFARMMAVFDQYGAAFVSVTQQFHSATSMGRLILNVLLSFAQFERELISERTRDKIAATRRKGKWAGGHPILGYDVDPHTFKLVVNDDEAGQVRAIFQMFLESRSLLPVVEELNRRGWVSKCWRNRKQCERGGKAFTRPYLHRLLTNVLYAGKTRYKQEVHQGEHAAIVDAETFNQVQDLLQNKGGRTREVGGKRSSALLQGLLRCTPCGCAMTPSHTNKKGKRYYYYTCLNAQKRGWRACPSKSISASAMEALVLKRIRCLSDSLSLKPEASNQAASQGELATGTAANHPAPECDLMNGRTEEVCSLGRPDGEEREHACLATTGTPALPPLHPPDVSWRKLNEEEIGATFAVLDRLWPSLTPLEQRRLIGLLVQQVGYDGAQGKIAITFHADAAQAWAEELASSREEKTS